MTHSVEVQQIPDAELRGEFLRSLGGIVTQYQQELGYELLHDATTYLYVARTPDTAVGLANVLPCGPREYEIAGRVVDRDHRGQGIGSSMTRFILNHLGSEEVSARTLWTNPIDDLSVAEPLKRLGFTEENRNGMPALRYVFPSRK